MSFEEVAAAGADHLEHYGVKGMKWGKRQASGPSGVELTPKGRRLKAKGGQGHPTHEDAASAATSKQIANKSGKHALSNKDLQAAVTRMNLEKQFDQLNTKTGPVATGQKFVKTLLGVGKTGNEVIAFNNSPAGRAIRDGVNAATSRSRRSGSSGSATVVRRQIGA